MLSPEQLQQLKVNDVVWDEVKQKSIRVCDCLILVRFRIGYIRKNPQEFSISRHSQK